MRWLLISFSVIQIANAQIDSIQSCGQDSSGWTYPTFKLKGRLAEIFAISDCQWISGLTCRIRYNGRYALPSEVFFTEYDVKGKRLGRRTRLIYPHLKAGERGYATFRLRSGCPSTIELEGIWKGEWKNPY
jgi:hypothetical protein